MDSRGQAPRGLASDLEALITRIVDQRVAAALAAASPSLIDAPEAARILGISVPALRKRVQRGDMPRGAVVRTGKRGYRFRRDRLVP